MIEYKIGDIIKCIVTGITKYGIFVKVDEVYYGLIHISEISDYFVRDVSEYATVGDIIFCRVVGVNIKDKQLKLSIKDINYKYYNEGIHIKETRSGFWPLKKKLPYWLECKLEEYNYKK